MINLTKVNEPSRLVKSRAAAMWTRKVKDLGWLLVYRVTPHGTEFEHKSKSKRRVIVDLINQTAKCTEWHSGIPCQANADYVLETGKAKEPRMCCHVWAVLTQIATNVRRNQLKAA